MKAIRILAALSCVAVGQAQAETVDYQPVFESVFSHMALTYMCRNDLGGMAHYQAARTIAIGTFTPIVGRAEAILGVDNMDQKFRNDPRAANPNNPPGACIEMVNDSLHQIEVEKAKAGLTQ